MEPLSLSQLAYLIKETINISFDEYYMVTAEINQINVNYSGHAYLQLVEKSADDQKTKASIRAVIWANKYRLISAYFQNVTGSELKSGIKILVKAEVSFHEVYGLSLVIHDIDPAYTLGDMERQRQEIIQRLEKDGIMDMNKSVPLALVPQRVAIISSATAAGLGDFLDHLDGNEFGYKFYHKLFPAVMQGDKTEQSIINALDKIYSEYENFDVVVIIRGGGSKLDLSAFDSYDIAANIAQFPLPVLTGIGHQRDLSIADMVAFKSLKTPTATADFIVQKVLEFDNLLSEKYLYLQDLIVEYINERNEQLIEKQRYINQLITDEFYSKKTQIQVLQQSLSSAFDKYFSLKNNDLRILRDKLKMSCYSAVWDNNSNLKRKSYALEASVKMLFQKYTDDLTIVKTRLDAVNPEHILNLGYSLTYVDGKQLTSIEDVSKDKNIKTLVKDGVIESVVSRVKSNSEK